MGNKNTRKQKGGSSNSPSGWGYVYNTVGDGWTQFQNALTLEPGQNLGSINSNDIEPVSNINAQNTEGFPTDQNLTLIQKAGKKNKTKKGGNWGAILGQAAAPIALIGAQQMYKPMKGRQNYSNKKYRKGGNLAGILAQAAAPVALIGAQQMYKPMKGRQNYSNKKYRKGGNIAGLIAQAAAPVALIGAQQMYKPMKGRQNYSKRKYRKYRKY